MEIEAHDRGGVPAIADASVDASFGPGAVISVTWVYGTFFSADEKGGRIRGWEGHAGRADIFSFAWGRGGKFNVFLRLTEHIDGPATDDAVCGARDDIVSVLSANMRH